MLVVASVRVNHLYIGLEKISDPKRGVRKVHCERKQLSILLNTLSFLFSVCAEVNRSCYGSLENFCLERSYYFIIIGERRRGYH